jgi:hypothetical protein
MRTNALSIQPPGIPLYRRWRSGALGVFGAFGALGAFGVGCAEGGGRGPAGAALGRLLDTAVIVAPLPETDSPSDEAPGVLRVEAGRVELLADGRDETSLTLTLTDAAGAPVSDGTAFVLESSLGRVELLEGVRGGVAEARFRAGTWPGEAALSAAGWTVEGDRSLSLEPGAPRSVQLHLHGSLSEGAGTMSGSITSAEVNRIDVLWWTDHDFQYYPERLMELTGFDFETGTLQSTVPSWPSTTVRDVRWVELADTFPLSASEVRASSARSGAFGWHLEGTGADAGDWQQQSFTLSVEPRLNFKALLAGIDLGFWVRPLVDDAGAELFITIPLSARDAGDDSLPESYRAIHFFRSAEDYSSLSDETNHYVRIPGAVGEWTEVTADLSALAERFSPDLGLDQHAELLIVTVRAQEGATASFDLDDLRWGQALVGEALRSEQRAFLDEQPTDVVQLVGAELTLLPEGHLNAFGADVPFLPYADRDDLSAADAVELVHASGGLTSFNHIFGVTGSLVEEAERAVAVDETITALVESAVWGCDLLEVGYRQRGGELDDFLAVWDALSAAGVFVTGEGASDAHDDVGWSIMQNRFVTWVPAGEPSEAELLWNLRRGAAWFGDPVAFEGGHVAVSLSAPALRATMGQVVVGAAGPVTLQVTADPLRAGQTLRLLADGLEVARWPVEADGALTVEAEVDPTGGRAARVELLNAAGAGILFTNPIYFLDSDPGTIPEVRRPSP